MTTREQITFYSTNHKYFQYKIYIKLIKFNIKAYDALNWPPLRRSQN
jgi:hypothetical protein